MGRNLMRRVRWGNVALAAVGSVALAFGSAWAFSTTTGPALPADEARPLIAGTPVPATEDEGAEVPAARPDPETEARPKERARKERPAAKAKQRPRAKRERPRTAPPTRSTPAAPSLPTVAVLTPRVVAPAPRRTTKPPAGTGGGEFGFEGG